jgi:hypothetical protein
MVISSSATVTPVVRKGAGGASRLVVESAGRTGQDSDGHL